MDDIWALLQNLKRFREGENGTDYVCTDPIIQVDKFYQFTLIPAILFMVIFGFTEQRKSYKTGIWYGRPALAYPMDLMTKSNRVSYACAFGSTANLVYKCVVEEYRPVDLYGPNVVQTVEVLLSMVIFGIVYFPVFASLSSGCVLSYGLGSLYVWMLTVVEVIQVFECDYSGSVRFYIVLSAFPNICCLLFLSINLPYRFVMEIRRQKSLIIYVTAVQKSTRELQDFRQSDLGLHVQRLLCRPAEEKDPVTYQEKVIHFFHNHIYKPITGFRYSARILATQLMAFILLYMTCMKLYPIWGALLAYSRHTDDINLKIVLSNFGGVMLASTLAAHLLGLYSIFKMLVNYRETTLAIHRGQKDDLWKESSNPQLLLGAMKYQGYQVVSLISAFFVQFFIFIVLFGVLALIINVIAAGYGGYLLFILDYLWPAVVSFIALYVIQMVLVKYVFLEPGKHLVLNNRRGLFIMAYFIFFYNIFLGLLNTFKRLCFSVAYGSLILARLDTSLFPLNFTNSDSAYRFYQGFIKLENDHTHPVMLAFINLLQVLARNRDTTEKEDNNVKISKQNQTSEEHFKRRHIVLFRWHTLYTLINNPELRILRKGYIQRLMRAKQLGIDIPKSDTYITVDDEILKEAEELAQESQDSNGVAKFAREKAQKLSAVVMNIPGKFRRPKRHSNSQKNGGVQDGASGDAISSGVEYVNMHESV